MIECDKVGFSISFPSVFHVQKSRLRTNLEATILLCFYFFSIHSYIWLEFLSSVCDWITICLECINTSINRGGSHFMDSQILVWSFALLLVSLHLFSSSTETDLTLSLRKLMCLPHSSWWLGTMNKFCFVWLQFPVNHTANNKQLMPTEPTVHCTLLFCIAWYSLHLVGSAAVGHDLVFVYDDDLEHKIFLCTTQLR